MSYILIPAGVYALATVAKEGYPDCMSFLLRSVLVLIIMGQSPLSSQVADNLQIPHGTRMSASSVLANTAEPVLTFMAAHTRTTMRNRKNKIQHGSWSM
jgi:hypothetical protein